MDGHQFSTGSPQAATAGGRTRTRQFTVFRGLHRLVHGCISQYSVGSTDWSRAALQGCLVELTRKLAGPPLKNRQRRQKRRQGIEPQEQTKVAHPGAGCLTIEIELTGAYQTFAEPILWISRGRRLPWDPHSRLARSAPGVYYLGESVRIFKAC
ncbi:hypothetical protein PGT21_007125 [Puccinia graminis f. sp. tritici]|uniref:Uncharacterized protein n=1 Tax=Puccinia graminis f. sp. tritici TaxID=56615 RepID=A0A5B0LKW3_PUCGR|nr:hypothetical protein PGT21_007125 [Puccinia graminis f. sp. tritici]